MGNKTRNLVNSLFFAATLLGITSVVWAGPVGPSTNLSPDDVILNKGAVQNGKTFDVNGATIAALTSNTIKAQSITIGGQPISTATVIPGSSISPTTTTIISPYGARLSTVVVTGLSTLSTVTASGPFTGQAVNGTTGTYSGTVTGSNLTGTNTGDVTIGTSNGLSLAGQALSAALASSTSTGTLRAFDFNTFNGKLSPTGNGSALTGLTKTQVGLANVQNVDQTDAANVTTGTFDPARLATGTPSGVRYVRGDGFWALITSTSVGLGQVLNGAQVLRTEYTQKGGFLVGIGTGGIYAVQAPGTDGYVLVANSASSTGLSYIIPPSSFSIYPATGTGIFPYGARLSTITVDGVALFRGLVNGTTLYFSSGTFTGQLNAANLSGTNTGDVSIGTANGLVLQNQTISLSTSSATQTGALTAADWAKFNSVSTGTGHFSDVYVSSSLTWPDAHVQKVYGPVFNVKDYGATGNGTTDDYAAVQAALNAAHTANGGIVYGPAGTYVIGSTLIIYSSTTLQGAGIGPTTWKAKANLNARLINIAAPGYNINLMDATFDMNGSTQSASTAITIGGVHGHLVKNVRMINPYDSLYLLTGSPDPTNNDNAIYEDVIFDGTGQQQATDVVDLGSATNVRVTRMRSFNCKANTGNGLVVFGITQNLTITDSLFDANGNGTPVVLVGINGGKMDGCELKGGFEAGVRVTYWNEIAPSYPMKNFQIVNNNIHDNAFDGIWMNHAGISPLRPENIVIANNAIWNNQQSGFRCIVSSGVIFTGNYVFNNSLAGAGSYYAMNFASGFTVAGEINNIRVSDNRFYDNQATPTQTKLYNLSYVDQFVSQNNFISQVTVSSTVANSTNVLFLDLNSGVLPVVGGGTGSGTALNSGKLMRSNGQTIVESTMTADGSGNLGNVASVTSQATTPATTGVVRLGSAETISWRSNAGGGNLSLSKNTSDDLQYNGSTLIKGNGAGLSKTGDTLSLAALTASRAMITDVSGIASTSTVTATELGYVSGVTSAIQTQINTKAPSANPSFTGTITTPITASRAAIIDASSNLSSSTVTTTELGYVSGVTSAIQTQINTNSTNIASATTTARSYIGTFTYNLATASGTLAITGVGFQPKTVTFFAAKDGGLQGSNGMDNGTTHAAYSLISGSLNWWPSNSIVAYDGAGVNTQVASITTMGSDGFTLTWVKTGSPTGTYNIVFTASR